MSTALDCRRLSPTELTIAHPRQPEMRVTVSRGWWEVWDGKDLYASIPPTRRCLAGAVAEYWRSHTNGSWDAARPMPRFWGPDIIGGDQAEVLAKPTTGTRLQVARTEMQSIAKHLTEEILAPLHAGLDATVHAVWRRLSSCAPLGVVDRGRCAPLCDWFWDHPFLARDVMTIRGAALVVRSLMETYDDPDMTPAWEALHAGDWRRACCLGAKPNRALRVTLAQCPGRLPVKTLSLLHLRGIWLPRPRRTRLEVIAAMAVGRHALGHGSSPNRQLILEADDQQLRQALPPMCEDLFDGEIHSPISYRAYQVADLLDYPDPCPDLLTLARCSAEWHVIGHLNRHPSLLGQATQNLLEPTAIPPREPPTTPESGVTIRRLATVGDVLTEGRLMHHCVGGYTARAVAGLCFLYHVEVPGAMATVELNRHLRLVQARGPSNLSNAASAYAEQRFADLVPSQEDDACVPF